MFISYPKLILALMDKSTPYNNVTGYANNKYFFENDLQNDSAL
jgi:hypothetical protein